LSKDQFQIGDSVVIKSGVHDPDYGTSISGWRGRVSEIDLGNNLICIQWDSVTLKQIPEKIIQACEKDNLSWEFMYLSPKEVEKTEPRDNEDDVQASVQQLSILYYWFSFGDQGIRIQEVLSRKSDPDKEDDPNILWVEYLQDVVSFPFEAKVAEYQERGPLQVGDRVEVVNIAGYDELYGVLVNIQSKVDDYVFPLCDLKTVDEDSPNSQPIMDYATWFANRPE
jgi:hypothetical protein